MANHATKDQFFEALDKLTEIEKLGVLATANHYASGHNGFSSGQDLFHEAVYRIADGARHWPAEVPLSIFLRNVMRSIASNDRGLLHMSASRWRSLSSDGIDGDEAFAGDAMPSPEDQALANERQALGEAALSFARKMLIRDAEAIGVLDRMAGGLTAAEMRDELGISDARYRAARARVRVRLDNWAKEHGA